MQLFHLGSQKNGYNLRLYTIFDQKNKHRKLRIFPERCSFHSDNGRGFYSIDVFLKSFMKLRW